MEDLQGGTLALEHRYDIVELRDRHGLISAYYGNQDPFSRPVWVKVYDGLGAQDAKISTVDPLVDRLKESARISSDLQDPGILRVIDYGELEQRVPFVISERSPHDTLANFLEAEGTLSAEKTCALVERIAAILAPVHRRRRAHGALSPQWIYLAKSSTGALALDTLRIGHFHMALTPQERGQIADSNIEPAEIAVFAPEFFPADEPTGADAEHPEDTYRMQGSDGPDAISPAGDVWALGILAYTALVGVHPFFDPEQPLQDAIAAIQSGSPRPLSELGVDPEISDVILRAIAKDPRARYPNAHALADALSVANGTASTPKRSTPKRPTPSPAPRAPSTPRDNTEQTDEKDAPSRTPSSRSPANPLLDVAAEEREPGPSDRLLSVAIVLLILSNLAWVCYVATL